MTQRNGPERKAMLEARALEQRARGDRVQRRRYERYLAYRREVKAQERAAIAAKQPPKAA